MAIALVIALALAASARGVPAQDKSKPARGISAVYSYRPMYPQDTQSLLASIEERLRALDAASAIYAQQTHRLDAIEGKIDRLERALSLRVTQSSEATNARAELIAGRLGHKIEMLELKIKTSLEESVAKLEMAVESQRMTTPGPPAVNITKEIEPILNRVESKLDLRLRELMTSQQQSDQTSGPGKTSCSDTALREAFQQQVDNALTKVTNMYNELWRRSTSLESLTKSGHTSSDAMRREISDGFRSLARRRLGGSQVVQITASPLEGMEQAIDTLSTTIQRKIMQWGHNVNNKLDTVINNQEHFQDSCIRIQNDEKQIEDEIYTVLENLIDATKNKTFREMQTIHTMLKSHSFEMKKTTSSMLHAMETQQHTMNTLSTSCGTTRACRPAPAMRVFSDKLNNIGDSVQELHRRHEDYHSNTNKTDVIIKHMTYLLENAVQNISSNFQNSSDSCLFTLENVELHQLVNKLIELTEKVDSTFLQMEDRIHTFDKTHKYDYADEEYNDVEDLADSANNVTTAADILIDKLSGINEESEELFLEEFHDDQDDYIMTHKKNEVQKSKNRILNDNTPFENRKMKLLRISQLESKVVNRNNSSHHKRHLHNHPYDRGPPNNPDIEKTKILRSDVLSPKHFISSELLSDSDTSDND